MSVIETVRRFCKAFPNSGSAIDSLAAIDRIAEALADAEKALARIQEMDMRRAGCNSEDSITYDGPCGKVAAHALTKLRSVTNAKG